MSWDDANANCKSTKSVLVYIPNSTVNIEVRDLLPKNTEAWIGLFKGTLWYTTVGYITKPNWKTGEPDDRGYKFCVAENMTDGKWTTEACNDLHPFICNDGLHATFFIYFIQ